MAATIGDSSLAKLAYGESKRLADPNLIHGFSYSDIVGPGRSFEGKVLKMAKT